MSFIAIDDLLLRLVKSLKRKPNLDTTGIGKLNSLGAIRNTNDLRFNVHSAKSSLGSGVTNFNTALLFEGVPSSKQKTTFPFNSAVFCSFGPDTSKSSSKHWAATVQSETLTSSPLELAKRMTQFGCKSFKINPVKGDE